MGEREEYRRPKGILVNLLFLLKHDTTPNIVESARSVALRNQIFIDLQIEEGVLTKEKLTEISQNENLQNFYKETMHEIMTKGKTTSELSELSDEQKAGFLVFWLNYFENHWNIRLLTDEERAL